MTKRKHVIYFWVFLLIGLGIILYYDWRLIILFGGILLVLIAFYHLQMIREIEKRQKLEKK